jgi:hypothetical protein
MWQQSLDGFAHPIRAVRSWAAPKGSSGPEQLPATGC